MRIKKIGLVLSIILLIYFIGGIIYNFSGIRKKDKTIEEEKVAVQIKNYDYLCLENETKVFKDEFKNLKSILESDEIDFKSYAISLGKLFIIDLYTLNNKKNMYDVGGVGFVYPDARENYKLNVENTLYKYMEDIDNGKRKQKLPEVSSVSVLSDEVIEYNIGEEKFEGYKINVDISYVEDLEYDEKAEVILVKKDQYLYVVEKN